NRARGRRLPTARARDRKVATPWFTLSGERVASASRPLEATVSALFERAELLLQGDDIFFVQGNRLAKLVEALLKLGRICPLAAMRQLKNNTQRRSSGRDGPGPEDGSCNSRMAVEFIENLRLRQQPP